MINLREFRRKPDRLSDYLLWAGMIRPGVILNKDGSLQVTFRYRGPDLDNATQDELVIITAKMNNAIKRLGSGWAIYAESQRTRSKKYTSSEFPDKVTEMIDTERKNYFSHGDHFESYYFFTLVYLPDVDNQDKVKRFLIENDSSDVSSAGEQLKNFLDEADKVFVLFDEILPEAEPLSADETLTYLHSCISPKRHWIKTPEVPMYLDSFLVDSPLMGGLQPKLGNYHMRIISILSFPGYSTPGLLDRLNRLNFEYRWVSRMIFLDKMEAEKETSRFQKLHYEKRKSMGTLIKEMVFSREFNHQINDDAVLKAEDSAAARLEVSSDLVSYGYYTTTIVVLDENEKEVQNKAKLIEKTINNFGFTATIESLNAVDAWFGSLPGMCYSNVRRPLMSTLNYSHLMPISSIWSGPEKNKHLDGPPLLYTETSGNSHFRLDLHIGDVAHTMMVGPTGAGKSVHLGLLAAQFRKYKDAQVYIFDKGGSTRALTAGIGGNYYDLGAETTDALSFQPLAQIEDTNERTWALEWIQDYLISENVTVYPEDKKAIWEALTSLTENPINHRNITGLQVLIASDRPNIAAALDPLCGNGAYARLFDSQVDRFGSGRWQVFEMETLMNSKKIVPHTLSYLFHRIEQSLTGAPTFIILDECWIFFDNEVFAAKIEEWLRVLRKANATVLFATQNLSDITESSIATAILDSCKNRIFLPNPNAQTEQYKPIYEMFGLNSRELAILAMATQKRHYYYKSEIGSRLYELSLNEKQLAYLGASSKTDRDMVKKILSEKGKEGFNLAWAQYKNLPELAKIFE